MPTKKYHRTYIFTFRTNSGIGYYAGLRTSPYIDAFDDPYTGSGIYPKRVVAKYGPSCIISKVWFLHETEERMRRHEISLIRSLKEECGCMCKNIASGGAGGDTIRYATPERRREILKTRSDSQIISQNDPTTNYKRSESLKSTNRTSDHWKFMEDLYMLWVKSNTPTAHSFRVVAISAGYPDCNYHAMVKEFCGRGEHSVSHKTRFKSPIWDYEDELYALWINNNKCGHVTMRRISVSNGYPDAKYSLMIEKFRNIDNENMCNLQVPNR